VSLNLCDGIGKMLFKGQNGYDSYDHSGDYHERTYRKKSIPIINSPQSCHAKPESKEIPYRNKEEKYPDTCLVTFFYDVLCPL